MTRIFILALALFLVQPAIAATHVSPTTSHPVKTSTKRGATNNKTTLPSSKTYNSGRKRVSHHAAKSGRHHHHYVKTARANFGYSGRSPLLTEAADTPLVSVPVDSSSVANTAPAPSNRYMRWASSMEHKMVGMVQSTIQNLRYSNYRMGGSNFDPARGVYVLDCSDYVDHLLNRANPGAYYSLVNGTGTDKPTTADYYRFFNRLPEVGRNDVWRKISNVGDVQPGDILVFRSMGGGGHVMVVMGKPIPVRDSDVFSVRVADSARSGHSLDTRPPHASGIGIGTMLLKVDPRTEQLAAYSWKMGAPWKSNVNFAIARPANA
ncbi:MAG TPA: hypothetical protein VHE99_04130 [Gammaproteobacteria bacterium]|nr:hypothetical protein [Gammaproteobacteria bacterium]